MTKRRRFEGVLHLPWPLPVVTEALGLSQSVVIGSHQARISLPTLEGEFPNSRLVSPLDRKGAGLRNDLRSLASWGFQGTRTQCNVGAVRISMLLNGADAIPGVATALRAWLEIVQIWVESWLQSPIDAGSPRGDLDLILASGRKPMTTTSLHPRIVIVRGRVLSEPQVRGAFRQASRGGLPPAEHTLLASGRRAILDGDTRRAVIEAGSAVEVAMSGYITNRLTTRGLPSAFAEKVTTNANGVVGLHDLCSSLGWEPTVSKGRISRELAEVRNHAAHRGTVPDGERTRTAMIHAAGVVESMNPMRPQ